eukprot:7443339-Pyramimonas_sp.AAC.1
MFAYWGSIRVPLGACSGPLFVFLLVSWGPLGPSWALLGASWGLLGASSAKWLAFSVPRPRLGRRFGARS